MNNYVIAKVDKPQHIIYHSLNIPGTVTELLDPMPIIFATM